MHIIISYYYFILLLLVLNVLILFCNGENNGNKEEEKILLSMKHTKKINEKKYNNNQIIKEKNNNNIDNEDHDSDIDYINELLLNDMEKESDFSQQEQQHIVSKKKYDNDDNDVSICYKKTNGSDFYFYLNVKKHSLLLPSSLQYHHHHLNIDKHHHHYDHKKKNEPLSIKIVYSINGIENIVARNDNNKTYSKTVQGTMIQEKRIYYNEHKRKYKKIYPDQWLMDLSENSCIQNVYANSTTTNCNDHNNDHYDVTHKEKRNNNNKIPNVWYQKCTNKIVLTKIYSNQENDEFKYCEMFNTQNAINIACGVSDC